MLFFILGAIGNLFIDDKKPTKSANSPTFAKQEEQVLQQQEEQQKPEDIAKKIITETFGAKSNRDNQPRIMKMTSIPQVDGTLTLDCRLRIDDNLTQRYIVLGFVRHVQRAMQKLFTDCITTKHED